MWKLIKITQRPYLMNCSFGEDNVVNFTLYDHKESWCETLTLDELNRKAKLLNRRYDFNEENVRETLTGGEVEMATLEKLDSVRSDKTALKLKYRVKNCPFNYEWSLKKQTLLEFQSTFMKPLCDALMGCHEQIAILTDSLKKKDAEILQYRKEGAILNRKTLATKLFDFDEFANKYQAKNQLATNFSELAKFLLSAEPRKEVKEIKKQESPEKNDKSLNKPNTTGWSPGQRKRKIQELKQKHLERNMKTRKQNIVYESSQSQDAIACSSSQSTNSDFEQKKLEKNANVKPITETTQKLQKKVENTKSSSTTTTLKVQQNAQDSKLTTAATQNVEQSAQDSKSTSVRAINDQESNVTDNTTYIFPSTAIQVEVNSPKDRARTHSIEIPSDSDSEDIILTPRKSNLLDNILDTNNSESDNDETIRYPRKVTRNLSKSLQEDGVKSFEKTEKNTREGIKDKALKCLAVHDVVEISTDDDNDSVESKNPGRRYPIRRNTTNTPTKTKGRATRSSPPESFSADIPICKRRRNSVGMSKADFKIFESSTKNKSSSSMAKPLVVGEISSQLSAIRKELQSLEALRLADLKQRTCKA